MPTEYVYNIRANGYLCRVTIVANDCVSAKAMLEAQYGKGCVCGCISSRPLNT